MTDKERLIALLTDFGVGFGLDGPNVKCEMGMDKVIGYNCFVTIFIFDDSGKFIEMGAWE